jgi:pimeloyl-ACP methyl ester carboxylesterase
METFVLVPGAWLGGWCWHRVAALLSDQGHRVYPVTLTGLGDRAHLGQPSVGLATHVQDVVNLLDYEELSDVVLVGHSYAGMVAGSVAHQRPERIRHLLFLAANIPHDGESIFDTWSERGRAAVEAEGQASGTPWRWPFPAADVSDLAPDLSDADRQWLTAKAVGHPLQTFRDRAQLVPPAADAILRTFVHCLADGSQLPGEVTDEGHWNVVTLASGHWPMITAPAALAELLLAV